MDAALIVADLNAAQNRAVSAPPGNALVLAGAGSGKTRVLVQRIAWLIAIEGASPHEIMAVTFTNKAAAEMRGRVEQAIGGPARAMWLGTFHGIAHRLLRIHWREAGLPENFQILDADDQLRLIKRILRALDLDEAKWPARQAAWFINAQKDEGRRARDLPPGDALFERTHGQIYAAYEELCNSSGLVDFAELLLRSHEMWLEQPALLRHYQQRFSNLLVDEFQDTNTIQYAWMRALAGDAMHVTVVGDDDQSIYGWRGARVENIQAFQNDFDDVTVYRLEQNYRSTATILRAANHLIAHNSGRLGKELWTDGPPGEPISLYAAYNDIDEARFVAGRIGEWLERGGSAGEVGVLYRSNAQSRVIEEALLRAGIPYRIYGGLRFFERAEIRNAMAYLRLIINRESDPAFERVVNMPPRGIGERTLDKLRRAAREGGTSLWQASIESVARGAIGGRAGRSLAAFVELVGGLREGVRDLDLEEAVQYVLDATGLITYHASERGERGLARKENLEELVVAARQFQGEPLLPLTETGAERDAPDIYAQIELFVDHAALDAGEVQADDGRPAVQMMTLHAAKGLEFPLVLITGVEEGLFPSRLSLEEPGRLEEERRLAYVGVTRAMRQLYLTYAETRRMHGSETYNRPSRFIREIPPDLVQEVRLSAAVARPLGGAPEAAEDGALELGRRVLHASFGEGVVMSCEGHGNRMQVEVNFERVGTKRLMLAYANLEVIE